MLLAMPLLFIVMLLACANWQMAVPTHGRHVRKGWFITVVIAFILAMVELASAQVVYISGPSTNAISAVSPALTYTNPTDGSYAANGFAYDQFGNIASNGSGASGPWTTPYNPAIQAGATVPNAFLGSQADPLAYYNNNSGYSATIMSPGGLTLSGSFDGVTSGSLSTPGTDGGSSTTTDESSVNTGELALSLGSGGIPLQFVEPGIERAFQSVSVAELQDLDYNIQSPGINFSQYFFNPMDTGTLTIDGSAVAVAAPSGGQINGTPLPFDSQTGLAVFTTSSIIAGSVQNGTLLGMSQSGAKASGLGVFQGEAFGGDGGPSGSTLMNMVGGLSGALYTGNDSLFGSGSAPYNNAPGYSPNGTGSGTGGTTSAAGYSNSFNQALGNFSTADISGYGQSGGPTSVNVSFVLHTFHGGTRPVSFVFTDPTAGAFKVTLSALMAIAICWTVLYRTYQFFIGQSGS